MSVWLNKTDKRLWKKQR